MRRHPLRAVFEEAGGVEVVGFASHDDVVGGAAPRPSPLPQSLAPRARVSDPRLESPAFVSFLCDALFFRKS